jgi:hypothetical protein
VSRKNFQLLIRQLVAARTMRDEKEDSLLESKGGFAVIEMLIALTLLVAAMIPLAIVLSSGF